jgi:aspartyl-tRNA(Asn)/glutamyl-tRNA(Gln) amidotransferase subunit A
MALDTSKQVDRWMFLHLLGWAVRIELADVTTAAEQCERALLRMRYPQAASAIITPTAERARREAEASDRRRRMGTARSDLDGVPITWKDVFDVAGTVTTAGSASLSANPPAARDSRLVWRAAELGLVTVGKTNLSEFAFSGLGINQSFGTPANPNDPALVPGGSSSGAAAAVATGISPLAVGTDTSGSIRVPAAFCGCVGFRASKNRYGPDDFVPLSPTLDSVGILARTVDDIAALDRLLAVQAARNSHHDKAIRAVVPTGEWIDDCTPGVRKLFDIAVDTLRDSGMAIDTVPLPSLAEAQRLMDTYGTIVGAEAYARYGHSLSSTIAIEPATKRRIARNATTAETVVKVRSAMPSLRRRLDTELAGAVLLCPTVRDEPARLDELLASDDLYDARNASTLRTTMVLSYLGMCGISIPLRGPDGRSAVGLLASLPGGQDDHLLAVARPIAQCLGDQSV